MYICADLYYVHQRFQKLIFILKILIKQNIINSSEFASNLKAAREIQALEFSPLTQIT